MKTFWIGLGLALALGISSANAASIAQVEPGTTSLENAKLAKSATINLDGKITPLPQVAAGLRRKKVALFWAKVYVIQFFSTTSDIKSAPLSAISLTLQRNLGANQMKEGFESSLQKNSVDVASAEFKPVIDALGAIGDQKEGTTLWIALRKNPDTSETIFFENSKGDLQKLSVSKGFSEKFLSIWWGIPSDSGMVELHQALKESLKAKTPTAST